MSRLFLILMLLSFSAAAEEPVTSVAIGITHATLPESGTWWQREYPSDLPHNVPSLTIRRDWKTSEDTGQGYGYTYIGHFVSSAKAVASDQAYDAKVPWPLSTWNGNETMQGVFYAYRKYYGKWYIEGGPMLTYANWTMTIPDWVHCVDEACLVPEDHTRFLQVGTNQWRLSVRAGAGYRFDKNWSVDYSWLPTHIFHTYPGITTGFSHNVSLTYTF